MNYKNLNDEELRYFKQDFSRLNELTFRIRECLSESKPISIGDLNLNDIIDYKSNHFIYITIFQEFISPIRYGSKKESLEKALNNIIDALSKREKLKEFDIKNSDKTRILLEWETEKHKIDINKIHIDGDFDELRFEPGINGLSVKSGNIWQNWMPSDSCIQSAMTLKPVFIKIAKFFKLEGKTNTEIIQKLKSLKNTDFYINKSHSFVTYKDKIIPLYRGNILYNKFDYKKLLNFIIEGNDWLIRNMKKNGQFTYYYDSAKDNNIDHEHPKRRPPNLYYNDLRHAAGIISLIRIYEITGDKKYLNAAGKALDWSVSISCRHTDSGGFEAFYAHYNNKGKLGGTGLALVAAMKYRIITGDKTHDRYIEGYVRHLLSRITDEGEFMGYYIHPMYNNGAPLLYMDEKTRRETFSFYYPGEALLGLAIFINHYAENPELREYAVKKAKIAMEWIINERPKRYAEYFTKLPSDGWLMQATEEFAHTNGGDFLEQAAIDFVFNDARTMMKLMYKKDESPYLDFEGGMYYSYGDHYYPDGARGEGLIAAFYLAENLGEKELAKKILKACKSAAKCQYQLCITEYNNFAHKNPQKSKGGIKFKVTRQWLRTDTIQHVACFFSRLYMAEHKN